jgi:hypothetical protein
MIHHQEGGKHDAEAKLQSQEGKRAGQKLSFVSHLEMFKAAAFRNLGSPNSRRGYGKHFFGGGVAALVVLCQ